MGIDLGREGSGKRFYNLKLNTAQLLSQEVAILLRVALMHIQMHSSNYSLWEKSFSAVFQLFSTLHSNCHPGPGVIQSAAKPTSLLILACSSQTCLLESPQQLAMYHQHNTVKLRWSGTPPPLTACTGWMEISKEMLRDGLSLKLLKPVRKRQASAVIQCSHPARGTRWASARTASMPTAHFAQRGFSVCGAIREPIPKIFLPAAPVINTQPGLRPAVF